MSDSAVGEPVMVAVDRFETPRQRRRMPCATIDRRTVGFTLIEVLVASVILAVTLLSLTSLFILGLKNNAVAKEDTVMAALALEKMETLRRLTSNQLSNELPALCQGICDGACISECYPATCTAAMLTATYEDPVPDPNPSDRVSERMYVRSWQVERVDLGNPVGCVYKLTVRVGSRNGLFARSPPSTPTWLTADKVDVVDDSNTRRIVLSTYRR